MKATGPGPKLRRRLSPFGAWLLIAVLLIAAAVAFIATWDIRRMSSFRARAPVRSLYAMAQRIGYEENLRITEEAFGTGALTPPERSGGRFELAFFTKLSKADLESNLVRNGCALAQIDGPGGATLHAALDGIAKVIPEHIDRKITANANAACEIVEDGQKKRLISVDLYYLVEQVDANGITINGSRIDGNIVGVSVDWLNSELK
jgi:hypothetical protein